VSIFFFCYEKEKHFLSVETGERINATRTQKKLEKGRTSQERNNFSFFIPR